MIEQDSTAIDWSTIVRPGDRVMWGQGAAEPTPLVRALMASRARIGRFEAFIGTTWTDSLSAQYADFVDYVSYCGAGNNRNLARAGALDIWPGHYSELPGQILQGGLRVDVLLLQVAPINGSGQYSLSMACEYLAAAISTARTIVVEVNDQTPWTHGSHRVCPKRVSHVLHTSRALPDAPSSPPGDVEREVARKVASLIDDGATIQCGIGNLPEAVLGELGGRRDLGFHSGAMGDQAAQLAQAGVINNSRKSIDRGVSVAGVLMGSSIVRRFAHGNPALQLRDTRYTHDIEVLSSIDRFVAINAAIEVDLTGQVNAEVAAGSYVGAVGGGADFLRGAHRSKGGVPIVALPSRAGRGATVSPRIVAQLSGPVSTARSDAGFVVTEHGIADLRGQTLSNRIRRMIAIAHPADRAALESAAGRWI